MNVESKTELTPEEAIKCAYAARFGGVKHDDLAFLFSVNSGRVSEAVQAVCWAAENYRAVYLQYVKPKPVARLLGPEEFKR